jgi:predicted DNA-binding protein with PD1-like motif
MRSKLIHEAPGQRTYLVVMDAGDEAMRELTRFAEEHRISAAHFTAIGAFREATVSWFDYDRREYKKIPVARQVEVLALAGDVALQGVLPKVHAHVVLGTSDGSALGGHLHEGYVRPTLEVVLTESPVHLRRTVHDATGLPLIDVAASDD